MSIILKGIDLPKKAELFIKEGEKTIVFAIDNDGRVLKREHHEWHITDFEAIQIPKGARLIDANEISKDLEEWKQRPNNDDDAVVLVNHFQGIIRTAPTILESEEE